MDILKIPIEYLRRTATDNGKRDEKEPRGLLSTDKGVALIMALIITMVVFLLIGATLYVITMSTKMSGAGKRYASAAEAADGAVEVMKNSINLVMYGQPISSLPLGNTTKLLDAISTLNNPATVTLDLPGAGLYGYQAQITVERLRTKAIPGGRIEFGRSAGGSGGTAVYFRINTLVIGPNNTQAENTVLYRFVG